MSLLRFLRPPVPRAHLILRHGCLATAPLSIALFLLTAWLRPDGLGYVLAIFIVGAVVTAAGAIAILAWSCVLALESVSDAASYPVISSNNKTWLMSALFLALTSGFCFNMVFFTFIFALLSSKGSP